MIRRPQPTGPRYVVQFKNNTHQIFDTVYYGVVDAKPTAKAAQERADQLNARPPKAKRQGVRR